MGRGWEGGTNRQQGAGVVTNLRRVIVMQAVTSAAYLTMVPCTRKRGGVQTKVKKKDMNGAEGQSNLNTTRSQGYPGVLGHRPNTIEVVTQNGCFKHKCLFGCCLTPSKRLG